MKTGAMVVAMVLLGGCVTRMNTRSGGPEVTIKGVPMDTVRTAYAHELADEGFAVHGMEEGNVIGTKAINVVLGRPLGRGDMAGATVTLNFQKEDDGVRVLYSGYIAGPGEAREDWKYRQTKLEQVAEELESGR